MASFTPNLNLAVTPETTNKSFKAWRLEMDNDTDSNMTKIDDAFGTLTSKSTVFSRQPLISFDGGGGGAPIAACTGYLARNPLDVSGQSIDNPVSLKLYNSITVHRTGKNLIDQNELHTTTSHEGTVSITWNEDVATITSSESRTWIVPFIDPINLKAGMTYTLSAYIKHKNPSTSSYKPGVCFRRISDWVLAKSSRLAEGVNEGYVSCTYTPTEDIDMYLGIVCTGADTAIPNVEVSQIQLEIGSSRTTYEAYRGDKWVFDFSDIAPIAEGNIGFMTGVINVTRLGRVFDGTETWKTAGTGDSLLFVCEDLRGKGTSGRSCSHFSNVANISSNTEIGYGYEITSTGYRHKFRHPTIKTLDEWKAWLAQQANNKTPVTCRYQLHATMKYQIPLYFMTTLSGDNFVWTDEGDIFLRIGGNISSLQSEIKTLGGRVNDLSALVEALNELGS